MKNLICGIVLAATLGAFAAEYTVTTSEDDGSSGSLRALVTAASANDTIYIPSSLSPVKLESEIAFATKMLRLEGTGEGRAVIKAVNGNRLFSITKHNANHCVFKKIEFRDGDATGDTKPYGAAFYQRDGYAYVDFIDCAFVNNRANEGGALYFVKTVYLTMTDCVFRGNDATVSGGAVLLGNRPVVGMTNCVFEANTSLANGAIGGSYADVVASKCEFKDNVATNSAGAFYVQNCAVLMEDTTFSGNRVLSSAAVVAAGAVCAGNKDKHYIFRDCTFTNNISYASHGSSGSAGAASGGTCWTNRFEGCTFVDNHRPNSGGGAIGTRNDLVLLDCVFRNNTCGNGGGGALWQYNGKLDVYNCIFEGNGHFDPNNFSAGAAIYHRSATDMIISNTVFRANKALNPANGHCGAIGEFSDNHHSLITDCLFESNFAYRAASAISTGFAMDIVNCVFKDNVGREAPVVLFSSGTIDRPLNVVNCTFIGNEAGKDEVDEVTSAVTTRTGNGALSIGCGSKINDWVSVLNCTFVNNTSDGAAVHLGNAISSPVSVTNCVFLGNRDWKGNVRDMYNSFLSIDHTVTEQAYNGSNGFSMRGSGEGNHFGDELALGNLRLATELADNGTKKLLPDGTCLQTLAIAARSPLRGIAHPLPEVTTDARGIARDATPDIGAFEYFLPSGMFYFLR